MLERTTWEKACLDAKKKKLPNPRKPRGRTEVSEPSEPTDGKHTIQHKILLLNTKLTNITTAQLT